MTQSGITNLLWDNANSKTHGPYLDGKYDLRLCMDKPFWGYTHPLKTQYTSKNLSERADDFKKSYLGSSVLAEMPGNVLNERDLISAFINTGHYVDLLSKDPFIESELLLTNINAILKEKNVSRSIESKEFIKNDVFENHFFRYLELILENPTHGKRMNDQKVIDQLDIQTMDTYYWIIDQKELDPKIIINENNEFGDKLVLCLPCSCTEKEINEIYNLIRNS